MGVSFGSRCKNSPYAVENSNPNPTNFIILHEQRIGKYLILHVKYPDCKNFEGQKLMVYKGFKTSEELIKYNLFKLDPHFCNSKGSPIARFAPTTESLVLIERMIGNDK
jgi:hypothetical protein